MVACLVVAPLGGADWVTHSGSNQRDDWQRYETKISKDTLKDLKLLWKIRLETKQRSVYSLYGPLIVERSITDRGFKEIAFVAGANNDLFAVDADLGKLLWQKHFDWHAEIPETEQASFLCPGGLTAWPVLQPPPARGRGPGGPPPPAARGAAPAAPAPQRGGGGPFAIRPIYALSGDGDLHAVNINTGDDLMSPLKFLPPNGKPYSLAYVDNVIYTITGQGCGGNPNSVYSLDLNDPGHTVRYWRSGSGGLWGTAGPAIGSDGTVYAETGDGQYDPALECRMALQTRSRHERDAGRLSVQGTRPDRRFGEGRALLHARQRLARRRGSSHAALSLRSDFERRSRLRRRGHVGQPRVVGRLGRHALGAGGGLGPEASERQIPDLERRDERRNDRRVQGRREERQDGAHQRMDVAQPAHSGRARHRQRRSLRARDRRMGASGQRQGRRSVPGGRARAEV
ncbi:MAG: hypothetical protein DMG01_19985, partial [Acidobacteria bacterium]